MTGASLSRKKRQVRTQLHRHVVDRERPDVLPLWYLKSGNIAPVGVDVADVCDDLQTRAQAVLVPEPSANLKDRFHLESHWDKIISDIQRQESWSASLSATLWPSRESLGAYGQSRLSSRTPSTLQLADK